MRVTARNFSMGEYLLRKYHRTQPRFGFEADTVEAWQAWRRDLRQALMERLSPWPEPCELNPLEEEAVDAGDHWRQRVVFDSERDMSIPAWLLRPKDRAPDEPGPAIVAQHGHGRGKDVVVGLHHGEAERANGIRGNRDYALQLVRRGYVVLAPDARGWGERGLGFETAGEVESCDYVFTKAILLGIQLLTLQIWDGQRCLDYLCTRPDVDPGRLGCTGLSFGGNLALWLSALDERVKVPVISCFFSTYLAHAIEHWTCGSEVVAGLLLEGEMADVAGLIAPRPLHIQNGEHDGLGFPIEAARGAFARLQRIYATAGASDKVSFHAGPGGHQYYSEPAVEWFERWL